MTATARTAGRNPAALVRVLIRYANAVPDTDRDSCLSVKRHFINHHPFVSPGMWSDSAYLTSARREKNRPAARREARDAIGQNRRRLAGIHNREEFRSASPATQTLTAPEWFTPEPERITLWPEPRKSQRSLLR